MLFFKMRIAKSGKGTRISLMDQAPSGYSSAGKHQQSEIKVIKMLVLLPSLDTHFDLADRSRI